MIVDRIYKVSAFGNFLDIVPTADNMSFFLNEFKEFGFIPSVFQELTPQAPLQRIALVSQDNSEQVFIASGRLDYQVANQNDTKLSDEQVESINKKASQVIAKIFERFKKSSNRLALNTESLIIGLSDEQISAFMSAYSNPISLYNDVKMEEWNTRLMVQKTVDIGDCNEQINVITIISKTKLQKQIDSQLDVSDGFSVNIDINTIAENSIPRFGSKDVTSFCLKAKDYWDLIIQEMG